MPIRYSVDRARRILRITARGAVEPGEELALVPRLIEHPQREPGFGWLCDFRRREPAASAEHVREMARVFLMHVDSLGRCRMAAVVSRDVSHGMARMFDALVGGAIEVGIFRDPEAAEAWLAEPPTAPAVDG